MACRTCAPFSMPTSAGYSIMAFGRWISRRCSPASATPNTCSKVARDPIHFPIAIADRIGTLAADFVRTLIVVLGLAARVRLGQRPLRGGAQRLDFGGCRSPFFILHRHSSADLRAY